MLIYILKLILLILLSVLSCLAVRILSEPGEGK